MLTLRGAPALSAFRQEKLARKLCRLHPEITLLHTEYIHFAEVEQALEGERLERLASLLTYGPELPPVESGQIADATLLLVVPIPLAAAHQGGAVLLLTALLNAAHLLPRSSGG